MLQTVNIHERNDKPFAGSPSALQLTLELFQARPASSDMGQLIDLGRLPVKRRLNPVTRSHPTITRRLLAIRGRPETISCSIGTIVRGPPAITRDPQHLLSRHRAGRSARPITRLGAPVPTVSYLMARRSYTSALIARDIPFGRRIQTSTCLPDSQLSRVLTPRADLATNLVTDTRRQFLIAGALILIRGQLITIGGRLILIRCRLVTVRCCLILIGSCLV
ncbi:MAG TPA: hypothetical protein VIJ50_02645 [Solirubrobacteraceae bacterium]